MPVFHFHIVDGAARDLGLAVVLHDVDAARAHALEIAKLAAKRPVYGRDAKVVVIDSQAEIVIEVSVVSAS